MGDYEYPNQLHEFALENAENLLIKAREVLVFSKPTDLKKLSVSDSEQVQAFFFEVNAAFFKGEESVSEFGERLFSETITGREFYDQLSSNVEIVTRLGHANALSYPFSYFLIVLENFNEVNSG